MPDAERRFTRFLKRDIGILTFAIFLLLGGLISSTTGYTTGLEMTYSSFFGGSSDDLVHSMTVDSRGAIIIAGVTQSNDFPVLNAYQTENAGSGDSFLTKISSDGKEIVFSTYIGGSDLDILNHVAVDSQDNIIISGETYSSDYPIESAYQNQLNGVIDCFIMKFNPSGNLIFSTYFGGSGWEVARGLAFDEHDNILFTGHTISEDFPVSTDAYQTSIGGEDDVFIVHLSSDGQSIIHSTFLGGTGIEGARHAFVDGNSNYVLCGLTESSDFPTTTDGFQLTYSGNRDCFISIFDIDDQTIVYSSYFGGSGLDYAWTIGSNLDSGIIIVGNTNSSDFPTSVDSYQPNKSDSNDGFVFCFNSDMSLNFSTFIGDEADDEVRHFTVNSDGLILLVGGTSSTDFPSSADALQPTKDGFLDSFIVMFDPIKQEIVYSSFLGGSDYDYCWGLYGDTSLIMCGTTGSNDFPVVNPYQEDIAGLYDGYICKFILSGADTDTNGTVNWPLEFLLVLLATGGIVIVVLFAIIYKAKRT